MSDENKILNRGLDALLGSNKEVNQKTVKEVSIDNINVEGLELVAEDLKLARKSLDAIVGVKTSDSLLGDIFSSFCIGK